MRQDFKISNGTPNEGRDNPSGFWIIFCYVRTYILKVFERTWCVHDFHRPKRRHIAATSSSVAYAPCCACASDSSIAALSSSDRTYGWRSSAATSISILPSSFCLSSGKSDNFSIASFNNVVIRKHYTTITFMWLELHLHRLASGLLPFREFKELACRKSETFADSVRWKLFQRIFQFLHHRIVETARGLNLIFRVGKFTLKLHKIRVRFEVGIIFRNREKCLQRAREHVLRFRLLLHRLRVHRAR